MITIKLFCSAGLSTSLLVTKMQAAAKERGIEADISAHPESQMQKNLEKVDVVLLGPQARLAFEKAKKLCEPKGIPIEIIPMQIYGRMDGNTVLDFALDLMK